MRYCRAKNFSLRFSSFSALSAICFSPEMLRLSGLIFKNSLIMRVRALALFAPFLLLNCIKRRRSSLSFPVRNRLMVCRVGLYMRTPVLAAIASALTFCFSARFFSQDSMTEAFFAF